jgi:hypothetical protein
MTTIAVGARPRALDETKDFDILMASQRHRPLHHVLPARTVVLLVALVMVLTGLTTAAFHM